MKEPRTLPPDKLEALIEETEGTPAGLKVELVRRDETRQHHEIDRLEQRSTRQIAAFAACGTSSAC